MLDPAQTLDKALGLLAAKGAEFGVVVPADGVPAVLGATLLRQAGGLAPTLGDLAAMLPRLLPVSADAPLQPLTLMLARDLLSEPQLDGLPITDAGGAIIGIVPRAALLDAALRLSERGGDIALLEGEATSGVGMAFICPQDNEQRWIVYYQPANPPVCSKGHRMAPKR